MSEIQESNNLQLNKLGHQAQSRDLRTFLNKRISRVTSGGETDTAVMVITVMVETVKVLDKGAKKIIKLGVMLKRGVIPNRVILKTTKLCASNVEERVTMPINALERIQ